MNKLVLSVDFKAVQISRDEAGVLLGLVRRRLRQESRRRTSSPERTAKREAAIQAGIPDLSLQSITKLRRLEDVLLAVLDV